MDEAFLREAVPVLLRGAANTILHAGAGILLGFVIGAVVAAAAMGRSAALRRVALLYVSFFRGVPLLVQLLLAYYAVPFTGLDVPAWGAAIFTLGLCSAAYSAEILRGGLTLVAPGAIEAARLLGLTPLQVFLRIRLPIAAKAMRPALVNEAILLLKASSLISVVGVSELTRNAQALAANTFQPLPAYALCGLFYLAINLVLSAIGGVAGREARQA